uniref:Kinesin-like protein n=1 Tax=Elaeis guineensis var. tenera TaxID=51953 RepID=A0A6I9S2P7_ELAGV|nr:kinesin-like protein KIN-7L [Elaeis guineensis]
MEKISVAVRFRPSTAPDLPAERQWRVEDNRISLHLLDGTPVSGVSFAFDHVFDQSSTNATVYDLLIKSIIHATVNGFNGTAFAYGQTSSGKTFTMNGSEDDPGIIPRAVRDIFHTTQMTTDREFLIRVSYMEIYNEEINDLLTLGNQKLPIHESLERGIFVAGLREEIVNSAEQVFELIKLGEANRHFGETNMNVRSSRSHTIFRMVIESSVKDPISSGDVSNADAIRVSVLNLVDLAGSERIAKTGAGGVRLKEGKHINKSLMILGNVINKLSENGKQRGHIPYRDSKLTRILQPALGGNAKTSIICTVAPEEVHIEESRGTLQFASRAKRITNCAQVNEILTDAALLKRQKLEIEELRRKLQGSHSEVLEQVILKQRNDMHKSELECERLAMQLEEERRSREALEHCIREQQKKINNFTSLANSSDQARSSAKQMDSRNTNDEVIMPQEDAFKTPNFKVMPHDFVVKRSNCSRDLESSPLPENFANVADEDLWMRLNKGCTTDLDMLQMTPDMKYQSFTSSDISVGLALEEEISNKGRLPILETECRFNKHLEASKEECAAVERECNLLREEKASLMQALSMSKQDVELLAAEKEELLKELNIERQKMKDLKEEIHVFSLAFSQREGLLTALYSKSKAMVENLKASQVPIPELYDC